MLKKSAIVIGSGFSGLSAACFLAKSGWEVKVLEKNATPGGRVGDSVVESIIYYKSYATSNFIEDYHSFKGNAYGLANTLLQTSILKPNCRRDRKSVV